MTSSTAGDRRWGTTRRSGMTVLGKVAVPKPINLPSQRLENQGLDPNVEIVPKGTLSWGSKSALNAWGLSSLSPRTDSGTGSPSHLSNHPSSGGTGTRPSTSSSDRGNEPSSSAWGSNSRPSSASAVLTSNQTSLTPLRPRSAETRPGSSHLSRFAEPLSENSMVWGAPGTAEKLGVSPSKNDGFSLTSGDFPSLGSEKECFGKSTGSQDHGSHVRPSSSSGRPAAAKERSENPIEGDILIDSNTRSDRKDDKPYSEDGIRHSFEERQEDPRVPQPYPNPNFPHQHFDTWRGPPINNHPGGFWYRGPHGGHPYAPPVGHRGFPMDPFPYYPQPAPAPGGGPRANHLKNGGDMYRPPMPDSYVRPGMPIRPGFYPGPVPYEGYYGPPLGCCNPNDRDMPFIGMPPGPYGYHNKHPGQAAHDPPGKSLVSEQAESGHSHEPRGPYKVLLKPQEGQVLKAEGKWEESATNRSNIEKEAQQRPLSSDNDWRSGHSKDRDMNSRRKIAGSEASSQTFHHQGGGSDTVKPKLTVRMAYLEAFDGIHINKDENAISDLAAPGDTSLIQKIEGLNAKARTSDGGHSVISLSSKEEQRNKSHIGNSENSVNKVTMRNHTNIQADSAIKSSPEVAVASGNAISRRSTQGVQGRADHRIIGRVTSEVNDDGGQMKPHVSESSSAISSANLENCSHVYGHDSSDNKTVQKSGPYPQGRNEEESGASALDPSDNQRSMMRELAKLRVIQRQKEEEERARDQQAKALAKLEELNRRTQGTTEDLTKKVEAASDKLEESGSLQNTPLVSSSNLVSAHDVLSPASENICARAEKPKETYGETRNSTLKEAVSSKEDGCDADTTQLDNLSRFNDGGASKQKHVGYKQKQNLVMEKKVTEKSSSMGTTEAVDVTSSSNVVIANEVVSTCDSNFTATSIVTTESTVHLRRKNNRNGKRKHKVEETPSMASSGPVVSKQKNTGNESVECSKPKSSDTEFDSGLVQTPTDSKETALSPEQQPSLPNEEKQGRANNQWKSQLPHRTQRNPHANKPKEKFHSNDAVIWAPVRAHNKTEAAEEGSQKAVSESVPIPAKSGYQSQNNPRCKRLEMERYVPKPIAKEMAQQSVSQKEIAATIVSEKIVRKEDHGSQATEISQPAGSTTEKLVSVLDSTNGDGNRQSKHGKRHGSWRQCDMTESTKTLDDGQSSNSNQIVQKPVDYQQEHHQTLKSDVREQPSYHDEWNPSDGWNMIPESHNSNTENSEYTVPVGTGQGMTSHGKRQAFKGHKGRGNNYVDHKETNSGDANRSYMQHSGPEMSHVDMPGGSKENRFPGDRLTSQWQPKSQTSMASNHREGRSNDSQSTRFEAGRANKKDLEHHSPVNKGNPDEAPSAEHQDTSRERNMTSFKRRVPSQNQGPANMDAHSEHHSKSGFRKNINQNRRFGKGHESRGDWGSTGHDDWHHHHHRPPSSRERERHNSSHYEYLPVGAHNDNDRASNPEQPKDVFHSSVPRYREKNQSNSRHEGGKFYRQQRGCVGRDGSYD